MPKKIAIVADWLTVSGGAEAVVRSILRLYPAAEVFTTIYEKNSCSLPVSYQHIHTSRLQHFPKFLRKRHALLLPFLPLAIESLDLSGFDIVVSSSSFIGKGVITHPQQLHICYCHTPTRYLWGEWQQYLRDFPIPKVVKVFLPRYFTHLRKWDVIAAERPDTYIANSEYIKDAIKKYYHRDAEVITPPTDWNRFRSGLQEQKADFYLSFGRLVPQKKVDLLIRTFRGLPDKKLVIGGTGRNEAELKKLAEGAPNITFIGYIDDAEVPALLGKARALLFPQLEDAGITALEALAAGTPVIAYGKGGVLTTLQDGVTGILFPEQSPVTLRKALTAFETLEPDLSRAALSAYAKRFSLEHFEQEIKHFVEREWEIFSRTKI